MALKLPDAEEVEGVEVKNEPLDVTTDELKLIEAMRHLGILPKLDKPEDLKRLKHAFRDSGEALDKPEDLKSLKHAFRDSGEAVNLLEEREKMPVVRPKEVGDSGKQKANQDGGRDMGNASGGDGGHAGSRPSNYYFPKFSVFFGDKGEMTWPSFKFEVETLRAEKVYSDEQISIGLMKALKGSANDKIRRLGGKVSPDLIMRTLEDSYGSIESKETIMCKFYTCVQKKGESVEGFASRLEEYFSDAVQLGALKRTDREVLKGKLYGGLTQEIKQTARYIFDRQQEYAEFKLELRRLEAEMNVRNSPDRMPGKAAVKVEESREMQEMKELLRKMNARIEDLESEKRETGFKIQVRGQGVDMGRGRGRGNYRPSRPLSRDTFVPTCFFCNRRGHVRTNCPELLATVVCYRCNQKGHRQQDCPKA